MRRAWKKTKAVGMSISLLMFGGGTLSGRPSVTAEVVVKDEVKDVAGDTVGVEDGVESVMVGIGDGIVLVGDILRECWGMR